MLNLGQVTCQPQPRSLLPRPPCHPISQPSSFSPSLLPATHCPPPPPPLRVPVACPRGARGMWPELRPPNFGMHSQHSRALNAPSAVNVKVPLVCRPHQVRPPKACAGRTRLAPGAQSTVVARAGPPHRVHHSVRPELNTATHCGTARQHLGCDRRVHRHGVSEQNTTQGARVVKGGTCGACTPDFLASNGSPSPRQAWRTRTRNGAREQLNSGKHLDAAATWSGDLHKHLGGACADGPSCAKPRLQYTVQGAVDVVVFQLCGANPTPSNCATVPVPLLRP
jgi:hypothetical protein